jgi:SAM-dependent methyltransferase
VDFLQDREAAQRLAEETHDLTVDELVERVFSSKKGWSAGQIRTRTRQVVEAPARLQAEVRDWLGGCMPHDGVFLDLGCGPGMLLAAAASSGFAGVGVDASMVWLVVARRLIMAWGGQPRLAAGVAEALPFPDGSVAGVVSLDVIEHVADPVPFLREIDRVTRPGGTLALSTPNRFSLAAEPHVFVWGVGWLPRSKQKQYVRWRSGKSYEFTRLLSTWEMSRLLRHHTRFKFEFRVPAIPASEIAEFPARRAVLARGYNTLVRWQIANPLLLRLGPFFRVIGTKPTTDHRAPSHGRLPQ